MEWLLDPFKLIDELFESPQIQPQWKNSILDYLSEKLGDYDSVRNSIPSMNSTPLHNIRNESVVRFRCMIQDMFNPEFYLGAYEMENGETGEKKLTCGLFRDLVAEKVGYSINSESSKNVEDERMVYHCVSIPGENQWVKELYCEQSVATCLQSTDKSNYSIANKRSQDLVDSEMDMAENEIVKPTITTEISEHEQIGQKRIKINENGDDFPTNSINPYSTQLYLPWPDDKAVSAIVKICGACDYSLNDVVEFVGIISMDPQLALATHEINKEASLYGELQMEEDESHHPPPSLVPRLHVLKAFPLLHNNPLLPFQVKTEDLDTMASLCTNVRSQLQTTLEKLFGGDSLAANYLICHLVSFIHRSDAPVVGKCLLNFTNVSSLGRDFVNRFYAFISLLVTKSVLLPISLENLNTWDFIPTKDYTTNRLVSGRLQLSSRTHLVIDETALNEGQLIDKGVRNVAALETLMQHQEVMYDFKFNKISFKADVPVIILSHRKSILDTDFVVPLCPNLPCCNFTDEDLKDLLHQFRTYLTLLRFVNYNHLFSTEIQQQISNFFVEERQKDVHQMSEEIFHRFLALSKQLSLSFCEKELNLSTWEKTKELEFERKDRLRV